MRNQGSKTQLCRRCKKSLPLDRFHNDKRTPTGHYDVCKHCRAIDRAITNIDAADYQELLAKQNYACAICGTAGEDVSQGFNVDHDHATHKVRGLLCTNCNVGLGYFKDSITNLTSAINYLLNKDDVA
tara:strand:+ start:1080 stop:1463 length:384 start_codon:yes stop_codon:yes gene_type:complete